MSRRSTTNSMKALQAFLQPIISASLCCSPAEFGGVGFGRGNRCSFSDDCDGPRRRYSMSPSQFAELIRTAGQEEESDIPKLAEKVASEISNFTCFHLVAALEGAPQWDRTELVRNVIVYCVDLESQHSQIQRHLTEWERTMTDRAFKKALEDQQAQRGRGIFR